MSKLKLEYEILVCGIYPFNGVWEKSGFTITQNSIDEQVVNNLASSATFDQGKDAGLDYEKDRRWLVRVGTDILEFFGWL